jgi:DNA repair exonuclease SbcCD ATPase subunit
MIHFKNLTVKNFMSVGNATQGIDFDRRDLTLVLGENLDLGGDGSRNGTGKTTIINALSYALYGQALSNIRKDNLVNKTNAKHMLVSLDFNVGGREYKIERGRKPNVLKFYVNNEEQAATDEAQGDSRETQEAIERILGMSHDMFKHILALNTYTEPFLSLKANEQRIIIEQLLGITQLSERADRIKELNRQTKDAISQEEFRIRAVQEANKRIEEQIESLRKRQTLWLKKQQEDCTAFERAIRDLEHINIDQEVQAHRDLDSYQRLKKNIDDCNRNHRLVAADITKLEKNRVKLEQELAMLNSHRCHACGQDIHDNQHETIKLAKLQELEEINATWQEKRNELVEYENELDELGE